MKQIKCIAIIGSGPSEGRAYLGLVCVKFLWLRGLYIAKVFWELLRNIILLQSN